MRGRFRASPEILETGALRSHPRFARNPRTEPPSRAFSEGGGPVSSLACRTEPHRAPSLDRAPVSSLACRTEPHRAPSLAPVSPFSSSLQLVGLAEGDSEGGGGRTDVAKGGKSGGKACFSEGERRAGRAEARRSLKLRHPVSFITLLEYLSSRTGRAEARRAGRLRGRGD